MSVFHTYAAAHAKISDDMAKRAEARAQEAKLAVTEAEADEKKAAEQQAAMVATASDNTGTKRPASHVGGKTKAKKPALADQVAAARAAHAENVAKQAKAKPTKLEKDIAKEIKLLKTTKGGDKSQDYTVRRCVQRIEALVEKDEANAVEALVAKGGIEAIIETDSRQNRSTSYSDDLSYLSESSGNIFSAIVRTEPKHLLTESRFSILWGDVEKKMKEREKSTWFPVITELFSNDVICEQYLTSDRLDLIHSEFTKQNMWDNSFFFQTFVRGLEEKNAFSRALLERLSPKDFIRWSEDYLYDAEPVGEEPFSYYQNEEHAKMNTFLCLVAESPLGLAKMKQGDVIAIKKFVTAHEREYESKSGWGHRIWRHGHKCDEGCHNDSKKIMELLG